MSGKAVSARSRKQTAQLPPITCARCGRKIRDGKGKRIPDLGLVCPRCARNAAAQR